MMVQSNLRKITQKEAMSLRDQLTSDMKDAMRARDSVKLSVVRFLLADIKSYEIDHGEATDKDVLSLISKQVKQMKDAIDEFEKGGRDDLVKEESEKVKILENYLPEQMSDDALTEIVDQVLSGMDSPNMGQVMREVMAKVQGQADGKRVSQIVNQRLHT